jgi:predicted aspartyl protease
MEYDAANEEDEIMATSGVAEMGRVTAEIELTNYQDAILAENGVLAPEKVRRGKISGIVDTGAARLVLPKTIADELGFVVDGETSVRYADQRTAKRTIVRDIRLELCHRHGVFNAIVEPDRKDALIGAIVMEDLDLIVDCTRNEIRPRDPDKIITEVE